MGFLWVPATMAAVKAMKAAAAAARAAGCVEEAAALTCSAFTAETVVKAADCIALGAIDDDPEVAARTLAAKTAISAQVAAAERRAPEPSLGGGG